MYTLHDWYEGNTLEIAMMADTVNIDNEPPILYMRAILFNPETKIRTYQKLIPIKFDEDDKLDD